MIWNSLPLSVEPKLTLLGNDARAQKAKPLTALVGTFTPPAKMFDEIIRGDAKAIRYIPFVGPYLYEQQQQKKKEESKK